MSENGTTVELVGELNAIEAISRAEVDIQISTAHRFPRNVTAVKQAMMSFATLDQETAESCFYSLPRGGKNILGPSVRLAEIAVSCYGNIRAGSRIIQAVTSGDNPHVVVQAVAHDLEKNVAVTIEKRRRITKKRKAERIDEDDISLAANAGSAIAFRDAVFKVIPGALIKPVFEQAKRVAIGDAKTLANRRAKAIDSFAKMSVSKDRILAKLGRKSAEEIDLGDLETLIGLHNAIKDGEMTVDEAFPTPEVISQEAAAPSKPEAASEEKAEAAAGLAPESPATAQPTEAAQTPRGELQHLVESVGADFTILQAWGIETGVIPGVDAMANYEDIPAELVRRLLNAKRGLTKGLAAIVGAGGAR